MQGSSDRWEQDVVIWNHRNVKATAMSVDATGSIAVLGSKRQLVFIDLNNPTQELSRLKTGSKFELNQVLWNPAQSHKKFILTTYSQDCNIFEYSNDTKGTKIASMSEHSRAISDADWSHIQPDYFATCSLDSFILVWDVRENPKKPKHTLNAKTGVSQVKWNKINDYNLASSHEGSIRLWDLRNPNFPVSFLHGHSSTIYSIDWHPLNERVIASSSLDKTIAFWDFNCTEDNSLLTSIKMSLPVWKVQFNPNHNSFIYQTFLNFRKSPIGLFDVNMKSVDKPEAVNIVDFEDHKDVVHNMNWRKHEQENKWQLVTWSKDQSLRFLQPLCDFSQEKVQYSNEHGRFKSKFEYKPGETDVHAQKSQPKSTPTNEYKTDQRQISFSLESEFHALENSSFQRTKIIELSKKTKSRFIVFDLFWMEVTIRLQINIKRFYPYMENSLEFKFSVDKTIENKNTKKMISTLLRVAMEATKILENEYNSSPKQTNGFIKYVLKALWEVTAQDKIEHPEDYRKEKNEELMKSLERIPFPRPCSASFSPSGILTVFHSFSMNKYVTVTEKGKKVYSKTFDKYVENQKEGYLPSGSHSKYKYSWVATSPKSLMTPLNKRKHKTFSSVKKVNVNERCTENHKKKRKVHIFDMSSNMSINKELAQKYQTQTSSDMYKINMQHADCVGATGLSRLWSFMNVLPDPMSLKKPLENKLVPHFMHSPAGAQFVDKIFKYYGQKKDVQTQALLAPLGQNTINDQAKASGLDLENDNFSCPEEASVFTFEKPIKFKSDNFTTPQSRTISHTRTVSGPVQMLKNSYECVKSIHNKFGNKVMNNSYTENDFEMQHLNSFSTLSMSDSFCNDAIPRVTMYDTAINLYSQYLENSGKTFKSLEIKDNFSSPHLSVCDTLNLRDELNSLENYKSTSSNNNKQVLRCAICNFVIRDCLYLFCITCSHGGHFKCMQEWLKVSQNECPTPSCLCCCKTLES